MLLLFCSTTQLHSLNFDTSNYIWDEWELFNPKGAIPPNPNDYQDPINFDDIDFSDFESDEEED